MKGVLRVRVVVAQGCHLCDAALDVVRDECGDAFDVLDITGDGELEATYRDQIPVIEIDGVARFTYFVQPEALHDALH